MLDRYWSGATSRISPEAPVPVVHVHEEEGRPGGAGNVALNVAALGGQAGLLGLVGDDPVADQLRERLENSGINCHLLADERYPTITKLRVLSRHQQLIRLDFEDGFPGFDESVLLKRFEQLLDEYDLVVLSDYGKGTLANPGKWIECAAKRQIPVLVDPKGRDFDKYRNAYLITPNMAEFEAVVGECADDQAVESKGQKLMERCHLENLLVTRGEQGMSLLGGNQETLHIPTHAQEVFDVTGAGDTVIAALAASLSAGSPLESAVQLANLAAGVAVGKLGTATVSRAELEYRIHEHQVMDRGVVTEAQLMRAVATARSAGESIVMTNGCFDILHAGHVTYLEEASKLGDRLVVALNVDETVRQLKGEDRPVNPLENRMRVMAALGCVDWVVPFSEETPERLICALQPDMLVKGGDNEPDNIPGGDCVREAGGEVRVLVYVDGVSTTRIVESIKENQ